jgi:translocation and assembly module TamB
MLAVLACLVGLVAAIVGASTILLQSLERPSLKGRIQALVRGSTGLEIDYRAARAGWFSGARIDGLVVHSPRDLRPFAPDLVVVGCIEARWSLRALLVGGGPFISRVAVSDVTVTIVVDEQGRTSFDAIHSPPGRPRAPPVPLSGLAAKWLGTRPPVGRVDVDHVTLAWVRTNHGVVSERAEGDGISLSLATSVAEPKDRGWRLTAGLGSPAMPLELGLTRVIGGLPAGVAHALAWLTVEATSASLVAALDVRMMDQSFAASVTAHHWAHAEASLRFDRAAGRTEIRLDHIAVGDGSATAEATIEVPDASDPIVHAARGDVDLVRLLGWLPAGLVPVTAERARVRYEVDSLVLGTVVHLSERGSVAVDADVADLVVGAPFGALRFRGGALSWRAQPAEGGGVAGSGSMNVTGVRVELGNALLCADDVIVDFEGRQDAAGAVGGRAGMRFARAGLGGAPSVLLREGRLDVRVRGLHPDLDAPLATRGDVSVSMALGFIDATVRGIHTTVDGLTIEAHALLEGHAPYAFQIVAPASRVRVVGPNGAALGDAPLRLELRARDVHPVAGKPEGSRGVVHAALGWGDSRASFDATERNHTVDFALAATAPSLKMALPLLSRALAEQAPWEQVSVALRSSGRVERLGAESPTVRQTTEIDLGRPAFANVAAEPLSLTLQSRGTAIQHRVDLDARARGLSLDGGLPGDDHVVLSATIDRQRPSLDVELATQGRATTKMSASVSFDRSRRALLYEVDGHLMGLAALAPLAAKVRGLEGFDLSELELGLSARGALLGVVAAVGTDGTIGLEPTPARSAAIEGVADVRVAHARWARGNTAIATPALMWHGDMRGVAGSRSLESRVEVGTLRVALGSRDIDFNGMSDRSSAAFVGDLTDPEIHLTEHLSVRAVEQALVPGYPLGDVTLALSAERGPEGVVHIAGLKIVNGRGGTTLEASGNVDRGEGRRTMSVITSLTQDLSPLSTIAERFKGKGKMAAEATVTSSDFVHYYVRGAVKGEDVSLTLARAGFEVQSANGEVPIAVAFEIGQRGVALERSESRSPYSMLRFADQHPLLTRSGFFSIASLKTPFSSIAPLVGNLAVEQNVVSLRQFEMGIRGGSVTGQCGLVWDGPRSSLELHVRASGVQSSHGEPFDGNIAITVSAAEHTVDGRAEILRIGPRHLLDLMDMQDPLRVEPAMNRIRGALAFGYPQSLRLVFDHGFASAHLELGGLARFISIGELRGIPMGPIVDRVLARSLGGNKEAP